MALDNMLCDRDLSEFLCTSRAADHCPVVNDTEVICDQISESLCNNIHECVYLDISKTNDPCVRENTSDSLTVLHLYIRSLNKNFDDMYDFLESLPFNPCVTCLSETRIKNKPLANRDLAAYTFMIVSSSTNAGGVAVYIQNGLKLSHQKRFDLHGCECL